MTDLSNCCQKPVTVDTADEGTNKYSFVETAELERLMRLDDNVKKEMCDLRITISNLKDLEKHGIKKWFRRKYLEKQLKLLESLYDYATQKNE